MNANSISPNSITPKRINASPLDGNRMNANLSAFRGGFQAELIQLNRSRLFLALTAIQAVAFLLLVSLFGLSGSQAPVVLVCEDTCAYSQTSMATLAAPYHSFAVTSMDLAFAMRALRAG